VGLVILQVQGATQNNLLSKSLTQILDSLAAPFYRCLHEIDGYTKVLLTIVALCLIMLCWKYLILRNAAQGQLESGKRLIGFTGTPFVSE
jgi:hypothetical protein